MSIDTDVIVQALPLLLKGLKVTAAVSLVGITIGLVIGAVAAYMADSAIWSSKPWRGLTWNACATSLF